jgi:hypothetical protein
MLAMVLPGHAGDGAAGVTWLRCDVAAESCWRWCYRVMLAMTLLGQIGHYAMQMLSYAGNGAAGAT